MPKHDFLLLPEKDGDYSDYSYFNNPESLLIDDDLILYIMDTMRWVPSLNPANPSQWSGCGLNYYGPTVINHVGAAKLARLFRLWASLLQEGPDELELTGGYEWIEGDSLDSGQYRKIILPRDATVKLINAIASLAEAAISGRYYVLHLGI